jgi:hypothetical protein
MVVGVAFAALCIWLQLVVERIVQGEQGAQLG